MWKKTDWQVVGNNRRIHIFAYASKNIVHTQTICKVLTIYVFINLFYQK